MIYDEYTISYMKYMIYIIYIYIYIYMTNIPYTIYDKYTIYSNDIWYGHVWSSTNIW